MGKVINLNQENMIEEPKRNSLISAIFRGTPYEFNLGKRKVQIIGNFYRLKKMNEFFDDYWPKFAEGINDIHPTKEFNKNYIAENYNKLNSLQLMEVHRECMEIYAFENKLTYSEFANVVNSKFSKKELENQEGFFPNGAA